MHLIDYVSIYFLREVLAKEGVVAHVAPITDRAEAVISPACHNYYDDRGVAFPASHDDPQQYPVALGHEMMNDEESRRSSTSRKQLFSRKGIFIRIL